MHRFFVDQKLTDLGVIGLSEAESRHAFRVLRIQAGERLAVLDGEGSIGDAVVVVAERSRVDVEVQHLHHEPVPLTRVRLSACHPKQKSLDLLLQKAVEMGVDDLDILDSQHSIARVGAGEELSRVQKWRGAAIEALKQCGGARLPGIRFFRSVESAIASNPHNSLGLVGSLREGQKTIRHQLDQYLTEKQTLPAEVRIWVGPEGDFSNSEFDCLETHGVRPVTLGTRVLRCETAALSALAVVQHELLWRRSISGT